jgi:hypothetical protein
MQDGVEISRGGPMRILSSMDWRISFASTVHQLHVITSSPAKRQDGTNTITLSNYRVQALLKTQSMLV